MTDLLGALVGRLEELGLQVDAVKHSPGSPAAHDVDMVLSRGASRQKFAMDLKGRATLSGLGPDRGKEANHLPRLVGATSVSPRSADALRRADIQYVDAAGNAWIRFGDVLIDVRGRRRSNAHDSARTAPDGTGGNLFSTGRAQVAFVLLQWPGSWKKKQRDVAKAAGVSLGQTHNALAMFREAGFGPGGHRSDSEFLDLWVASFPSGLARKLALATYRGSIADFGKANVQDPVFIGGALVSGEAAAGNLIRPATLTIYVVELDPMLPVKHRWRSDGDANITVRRKFWHTPLDETHDYDGPLVGLRTAPALLVYADLKASDDPRVRETAAQWRERIAGLGPSI